MVFEIPGDKETIEIGGIIYGESWIVPKFPPNKDLKRVQSAMKSWNSEYKRLGLIFSVVNIKPPAASIAKMRKMGGIPEELMGDRYTLCGWKRIGYTKAYVKTHPWVEYETYAQWKEAMEKKKGR